ncbi:MAG: nitroreductase family protein [Tissierellia bacterium]|nr:nitroreductase family protein [Tissierellia bacterium]
MTARKSTRDFKRKKISKKDFAKLKGEVNDINGLAEPHGAHFTLYGDGKDIAEALDGHAGYGGVMIYAPAYITMELKEASNEAHIYGAYYLEDLVTKADAIGLGSCWITVKDVTNGLRQAVFEESEYPVEFILAVGYPQPQFNIGEQKYSSRLGLDDIVFDGSLGNPASMSMLENYGLRDLFHYLRYAPSTKNTQPWRFLITKDGIELYMKDYEGDNNYVDIGIVMYYYVMLADAAGISAQWELGDFHEEKGLIYIGSTNY